MNLKQGDKFINGKIEYYVLCFYKTPNGNVALLRRKTYCPYVVTINIKQYPDSKYSWKFGHYFNHLENAYFKYEKLILKYSK